MMKYACNSFIAPGETWQEKFTLLGEIGYEGIEVRLIGGPEQQERTVEDILRIAQTSFVKPCSLVRPTQLFLKELTQESLEAKIADVSKTADFANALGIPAIVSAGVCVQPSLPSPFLPLPEIDAAKVALLKIYLSEIGKLAVQKNAKLLIEPLNRYEGSFYHRLIEAAAILDDIGNNHFGILADVFHINIEEADTKQALLSSGKWLRHVQLGDNNRLLPGQGQFNFRPFFEGLKEVKYTGYLALECIVPIRKTEPLKASLNYLREMEME